MTPLKLRYLSANESTGGRDESTRSVNKYDTRLFLWGLLYNQPIFIHNMKEVTHGKESDDIR